jgi:hypothetical protein
MGDGGGIVLRAEQKESSELQSDKELLEQVTQRCQARN